MSGARGRPNARSDGECRNGLGGCDAGPELSQARTRLLAGQGGTAGLKGWVSPACLAGSIAVVSHFATERCPPSHAPSGTKHRRRRRACSPPRPVSRALAPRRSAGAPPDSPARSSPDDGDGIRGRFVDFPGVCRSGARVSDALPSPSPRSSRSVAARGVSLPSRPIAPRARRVSVAARAALSVHTVQSGENLWAIARARGVACDELVAVNASALGGSDVIYPGQQLVIPSGGKPPAPDAFKPPSSSSFKSYGSSARSSAGFDSRAPRRGEGPRPRHRGRVFHRPRRRHRRLQGGPVQAAAGHPRRRRRVRRPGVRRPGRRGGLRPAAGLLRPVQPRGVAAVRGHVEQPAGEPSHRPRGAVPGTGEPQHLVNDEGVKNEESSRNASHEKGGRSGATRRAERARVKQTNARRRRSRQQTRQ